MYTYKERGNTPGVEMIKYAGSKGSYSFVDLDSAKNGVVVKTGDKWIASSESGKNAVTAATRKEAAQAYLDAIANVDRVLENIEAKKQDNEPAPVDYVPALDRENHYYKLIPGSADKKLSFVERGQAMAATYAGKNTCSTNCPLYAECYAKGGNVKHTFNRLTPGTKQFERSSEKARGGSFDDMVNTIDSTLYDQPLRVSISGDLPSDRSHQDALDVFAVAKLSKVAIKRKLKAWTYTHKNDVNNSDYVADIARQNNDNWCLNISTDTLDQAVESFNKGLPTVITLDHSELNGKNGFTYNGIKFKVCPNQLNADKVRCNNCMICQQHKRDHVVIFIKHK